MAAPTDVRVEAISQNGTMLRWAYAGSAGVSIYRSTDGASYSFVFSVVSTTLEYEDSGLSSATKYWYKLSDDFGSTFSSVVTVWTQACITGAAGGNDINLPRAADEVTPKDFNQAMDELENTVESKLLSRNPCEVCISDGRVVIDCSSGCSEFNVNVTEDVNSISVLWCSDTPTQPGGPGPLGATINWHVPANTTRKICGFPRGLGFSGDECFRSPITGGSAGRTMISGEGPQSSSPTSKKGPGGSTGTAAGGSGGAMGGGAGAGCTCVPDKNNQLTIKSCTLGNSLGCSSAKKLTLLACGGRPPYTWSKTGTITLTASATSAVITPPTNSGSGVAGTAYQKSIVSAGCGHTAGTDHAGAATVAIYGCNDVLILCPALVASNPTVFYFLDSTCACADHSGHNAGGGFGMLVSCSNQGSSGAECLSAQDGGTVEDKRTAGMISDGCSPCGLAVSGATVTVEDSTGTSVTITVRA